MKTSLFRFCGVLLLAAMLAPVCVHARKTRRTRKTTCACCTGTFRTECGPGRATTTTVRGVGQGVRSGRLRLVRGAVDLQVRHGRQDGCRRPLSGRELGRTGAPLRPQILVCGRTPRQLPAGDHVEIPDRERRTYRRLETRQRGDARRGLGAHREERQDGQHRNASHLAAGYAFEAKDRDASRAENGGDKYRRMEMEYICNHTIHSVPGAEKQFWMMMGDFNARSSRDNWFYKYPAGDTRFLVHDYILRHTPYVDVIAGNIPGSSRPRRAASRASTSFTARRRSTSASRMPTW